MKRDLDLCLKILRAIESSRGHMVFSVQLGKELGEDPDTTRHHCDIMSDAGLIAQVDGQTSQFLRLTWQGHEFLDEAIDPKHWEKAKDVAQKASGGFEIIKTVLTSLASEAAKRALGHYLNQSGLG
jgi:DNA-binding MarR family transcriptional regulator